MERKSYLKNVIIGGIEGGATHSSLIIIDNKGNQLAEVNGPGTNYWALGMEETASRINNMIMKGKKIIGIPESHSLDCVGLCLSGCELEKTNQELFAMLTKQFPNASKSYLIISDTMGSLKTCADNGGIVLIAGTGSNALLINPDGSRHGCGGWGHMMGDEGGAYWIAHKACKYVFDELDGLINAPYPINHIWMMMKSFFKINSQNELLPQLYRDFSKSNFALFTKELVKGCEKNDALCLYIFFLAGQHLGKHINALFGKVHNDIKFSEGGLKVICVGSVWKSWNFIQKGFIDEIDKGQLVNELSLLQLKVPAAIGACYLAGEKISCKSLIKTHDKNSNIFFHYIRNETSTNKNGNNIINVVTDSEG